LRPPLKEKKKNDSGREFNLGDSEEPDEVFFLMGACEGSRLFYGSKSGEQVGRGRE